MRPLAFATCPSLTKMSPFGATTTSVGPLNVSGPSLATPALAQRHQYLSFRAELERPAGLFPSLFCASVTQMLPSRSIVMPCACTNIPVPKLFNELSRRVKFENRWLASVKRPRCYRAHRNRPRSLLPTDAGGKLRPTLRDMVWIVLRVHRDCREDHRCDEGYDTREFHLK